MLQAAALNGFAIWIASIINWFRRVWYALHHAVEIPGVCETLVTDENETVKTFSIDYNDVKSTVKVTGSGKQFAEIGKGETADLLWIPGKKAAMFSEYKADEKSRKTVLICDILSLTGLVLLIIGAVLMTQRNRSYGQDTINLSVIMGMIYGSIILMIVTSIIRKKQKRG